MGDLLRRLAIVLPIVTAIGCGGGNGDGTGGTGGTGNTGGGSGGGSGSALYSPCPLAQRVGGFTLQLVPDGFTQLNGFVRNAVNPRDVWPGSSTATGCALVVGPTLSCTPTCMTPQICAGQNQCIDEPTAQDLGTVTLTGAGASALQVMPLPTRQYYTTVSNPYPPFSPGANVTLAAAGAGTIGAFSLEGRGIEPLAFAGTGILIRRNSPLDITWTAPAQASGSRIFVRVDIAHHGGIAARIECHVDDTGSFQVSADLINQLIDKGTAGFPAVALTRQTVDSATVGGGCVDFAVASPVSREVMVEGVTSCVEDGQCPTGQTCGPDMKCS